MAKKVSTETKIHNIQRKIRRQYKAEEKIRIVPERLRECKMIDNDKPKFTSSERCRGFGYAVLKAHRKN